MKHSTRLSSDFALSEAHMQGTEERDALLNEVAAKARETVLANAAIAKHAGHEQKKH